MGVVVAPGFVVAPVVAVSPPAVRVVVAVWGEAAVLLCAGCVPTALGLAVPLPSCEFAPVALGDSAGVWLVTGVFAVEPVPC